MKIIVEKELKSMNKGKEEAIKYVKKERNIYQAPKHPEPGHHQQQQIRKWRTHQKAWEAGNVKGNNRGLGKGKIKKTRGKDQGDQKAEAGKWKPTQEDAVNR